MSDLDSQLELLTNLTQWAKYNQISLFKPDTWQIKAIKLGKTQSIRGVIAANRLGKTYFGTYELALHLTGLYPNDWNGFKFDKPINALALGNSWSQLMMPKALHELLMGPQHDNGSGWIPKNCILNKTGSGQLGAYRKVEVQHISGEISTLTFGTYMSGDESFMGAAIDFFLIDECPNDKTILSQCVKRTWSTNGKGLCVFTPERGLNDTVKAFWDKDGIYHGGLVHVTLFDSGLYSDTRKQEMLNSVEQWAKEYSIYGRPSAGSGAVFSGIVKSDIIEITPPIQQHWKRLCGIDFGRRDTNVVIFITKDPETGKHYMYDEVATKDKDANEIAPFIIQRQKKYIPLIWPVDGKAERGTGVTLIDIYRNSGVICTEEYSANYFSNNPNEDYKRSITPGISYMRSLFKSGMLKVSPTCTEFLKEFDLYSYDDSGKFIDKNNHAIDSARYCITAIDKFGVSEDKSKNVQGNFYIPEDTWN